MGRNLDPQHPFNPGEPGSRVIGESILSVQVIPYGVQLAGQFRPHSLKRRPGIGSGVKLGVTDGAIEQSSRRRDDARDDADRIPINHYRKST